MGHNALGDSVLGPRPWSGFGSMVEEDLPFPVDVELLSAERSKAGRGRSHAVRLQLGVQVQPCARRYTPARRF